MLKSIVYLSSAEGAMSHNVLLELLHKSTSNNYKSQITGMLIYYDGSFIQVLEGEEVAIDRLIDKIMNDARHRNFSIIHESKIQQREFDKWNMSFMWLENNNVEHLESFMDFSSIKPFLNGASSDVKRLMKTFYEVNVENNIQYQF